MKSLVIYYSQSGNTKKIAQALQKGIIKETGQCDIARLKEVKPEDWLNYDLIGIGSPVYTSCPSMNVIYHIKSLPPEVKGKHAFFYCTHGILPGRCVIRGVQPLQEQGLTVIGWNNWYCAAYCPGHAKPWFSDGHPDAIDLAQAESFGTAMAIHSRKIAAGATDIIPTLHSPEASDQIYGLGHPFINRPAPPEMKGEGQPGGATGKPPETVSNTKDEGQPGIPKRETEREYIIRIEGVKSRVPQQVVKQAMRINAEKCIGCGLCAKACYYDNIDTSVYPPVFKSQGYECSFCEAICPTGAIETDFPPMNTNNQMIRKIMPTMLEIAEAKGRFRRLVREEDIGWDTPWEKTTGHPRFKEIP